MQEGILTKLLAGCLASASLMLFVGSSGQDDQDEKFQAIIAKIPLRRTDVADWKPSDVALEKKSPLLPWLRVYRLLNFRYPRSIVVDIREGTWAYAGEESSIRTIRENLPKWIDVAAIALDSPDRAREVIRFYIDFTEQPYSTEAGEIGMTPEGETWKAACTLTQKVPSECTAEPDKDNACTRKKIVHLTAILGRKGALAVEKKEDPPKGCVHGER